MTVPLIAETPTHVGVACLQLLPILPESVTEVRAWPQVGSSLNMIERAVLARVAVHTYNVYADEGSIPYYAPNAHQFAVAMALAAPGVQLLEASDLKYTWSFREIRFWITEHGFEVLRSLYPIIPLADAMEQEINFDKMRALLRNDWETWDENGPAGLPHLLATAPVPSPARHPHLTLVRFDHD